MTYFISEILKCEPVRWKCAYDGHLTIIKAMEVTQLAQVDNMIRTTMQMYFVVHSNYIHTTHSYRT